MPQTPTGYVRLIAINAVLFVAVLLAIEGFASYAIFARDVAITYPLSGASVYRGWTVRITADASDNVGVTRVDFYVNSQRVCSDATPSYTCSWVVPWNSYSGTTSYQILARAYDAAGNWRASTVTVFRSKYH